VRPKTTRAPTRAEAAPAGIGDGAAEALAWLERTGSAKAKGDMARYASDEHLLG
jgi:hypothetical protein